MLVELEIRGLAVAEYLRVPFAGGLTVITGETGAGKSVIIDALALLLGARSDAGIVRSGERAAAVQGVFHFDPGEVPSELREALAEVGTELDDGTLILNREQPAAGRSIARINGRAAVLSSLAALGTRLVDIHGQADHTLLLQPAQHLRLLDRYAGTDELREALAAPMKRLRAIRSELERLRGDERERLRLQDRLSYESNEIAAAELRPEEEEELREERSLLENAVQLAELADAAYATIRGAGRVTGAEDALGRAADLTGQLATLDPRLAEMAAATAALQEQASDLARELRDYREGVEHNPARLRAIEDRISLLLQLKRKYGATLAEVIAYREDAERKLEELANGEAAVEALQREQRQLLGEASERAVQLSRARVRAAAAFVAAVEAEVRQLRLEHARVGVAFLRRAAADGIGEGVPAEELVTSAGVEQVQPAASGFSSDWSGIDRVEFMISLNPGEPLRPLARVASGGETSRLLLALKTVLGDADSVPILVFDEIEAGLGGRTGGVVGEKLAALAERHQVICITHLPQIAAAGSQHLTVAKSVRDGRTHVEVREIAGAERVAEIAAMLGGVTPVNIAGARELLGLQSQEPRKLRAI